MKAGWNVGDYKAVSTALIYDREVFNAGVGRQRQSTNCAVKECLESDGVANRYWTCRNIASLSVSAIHTPDGNATLGVPKSAHSLCEVLSVIIVQRATG